VIARHGVTPVGSTYAYQCDVCHGSTRTDVQSAIAADDTTCLGCHAVYHANFDEAHEATDPSCVQVDCHVSTTLTTQHEPYVGAGGLYPEYPDTCSLCHANADPDRVPADADAECTSCHPEGAQPHGYEPAPHIAAPAPGNVRVFDNHEGMGPMSVAGACETCHNVELGPVHANICKSCHPTPRDSFDVYGKDCVQGGCHVAYHASGFDHAQVASGNCDACHDETEYALYVDPCVGCHAHPDPGDVTPPSTTADVPSSVVGIAYVDFSMTDGGKVGIGRTFRRLDGAYPTIGDAMQLPGSGNHTLEYWSVDQYGNEEMPHHTASFTVVPDTTPPATTSNVKPEYLGPANIALSATDASTMGVKGTYYVLDGGSVQEGTSLSVPQPPSGSATHTIEYWSDDHNGNVEQRHVVTFVVSNDTTPPTSTFEPAPYYRQPTTSIPYSATDAGSGVKQKWFRIDGGSSLFISPSTTVLTSTYTQGPHTVEYWSVDNAGNIEAHRTASFIVDWTAPTVTSNVLPEYPATGANITMTAVDQPPTGAGPAMVVSRIDGGSEVAAESVSTISVIAPGVHMLEYWAYDLSGNVCAHNVVSFTVGSGGPPTGSGILRLIWGDGSVEPSPDSWANWTVRDNNESGPIVATGAGSGVGWDGIDDVAVPTQVEPYWVQIQWYDDESFDGGSTLHFPVYVTGDGQIVPLQY